MINIGKFQAEIQKNMQAMTNEYKKIVRENHELKNKVVSLEDVSTMKNITKSDKEAVVFFAVDVSGSMGMWEKNVGKLFRGRLEEVLAQKYSDVSTRYVHHHTEAKLVTRTEFLGNGESGGTIASSAYRLMNKELEDYDYMNDNVDVYIVHISDGDNLTSDNSRCLNLLDKIFNKANKVIYLEANQYRRPLSTLMNRFKDINNDKFTYNVIEKIDEVDEFVKEMINEIEIISSTKF